jgi:hypothetical protein
MSWVKWENIVVPKALGGWGLKNILFFSKLLVANVAWHLITTTRLWTRVVYQKYIALVSLLEWIQSSDKKTQGISIILKVFIREFELIENGLA